jgi:tRNA(fMet)-specific endonuclease VapC
MIQHSFDTTRDNYRIEVRCSREVLARHECLRELPAPGNQSQLANKIASVSPGEIALCSVVRAELIYGALRSKDPPRRMQEVRLFVSGFHSFPFDDVASESYGEIRSYLAALGMPIGPNDLLIAAIALANGLIVITENVAEFSRVPRLRWENWSCP